MSDSGAGDHRQRWETALAGGTFEEVFAALEEAVAKLDAGQLALEDSIACYELGMRLAERCERFLDEAELRISRIESIAQKLEEASEHYDAERLWP